MKTRVRHESEQRIFYPPNSWMPVQNDVLRKVFPKLKQRRAAHLYMAMYERATQVRSKEFAMNLRQLGELIKCDPRTARNCIIELGKKGFVEIDHKGGSLRSRIDKPRFRVPLSESELASGGWVPVPRFLVTRYLQDFPGSLLLIILLYIQHFHWEDHCWVGSKGLQKFVNWKRRTIYRDLNLMGHKHRWEKLGTDLPWPLRITYSANGARRYFSVRAVQYYLPADRSKRVVRLSKEFETYFENRKASSRIDEEGVD
jgi:hypothetical protein